MQTIYFKGRKETSPSFSECTVIPKVGFSYIQGELLQVTFSFQCFSCGSNTGIPCAYEKMIYFYAYISLVLILFTNLLHWVGRTSKMQGAKNKD